MTHFEYDNTIRDLFGEDDHPSAAFPPDDRAGLFDDGAESQTVTRLLAQRYMDAAEQIAGRVVANRAKLFPCNPGETEDDCGKRLMSVIGARVWRRPLSAAEVNDLDAIFQANRVGSDFDDGMRAALETMLQSPEFIYRVELGRGDSQEPPHPGSNVRLTPSELASRLSYLLWGSTPDDTLYAAAGSGHLVSKEDVRTQATRMLGDPRARALVRHFYEQWLELDQLDSLEKDPAIFPTFTSELRTLFREETLDFAEEATFQGKGLVGSLLTAPYSFMNGKLAGFYGIIGPQGSAFQRVDLPATRGGILTQGSLLATLAKFDQTSPVHRGKFVRERLFCTQLPPPPANLGILPPSLDLTRTTRERFQEHSSNPSCSGCHSLIDPIGFGFEDFDAVGLYRHYENDLPVDASGEITGTDVNGVFQGARALGARLAASIEVQQCFALQWFRFGYGRGDTDDDQCALGQLTSAFTDSGGSIPALLVALTQTDGFFVKTIGEAP